MLCGCFCSTGFTFDPTGAKAMLFPVLIRIREPYPFNPGVTLLKGFSCLLIVFKEGGPLT